MKYRFLRFPGGVTKAVTLSYDDGCTFDPRFINIIDRYQLKCTFNINSGLMKSDYERLSHSQIKEFMIDRGHEIAIHGKYHQAPGMVTPVEGIRDVLECRLELEKQYGMIIKGMAYPDTGIIAYHNQADYETIKQYLKDLGIVYARTLFADNDSFELPVDWFRWIPTAHHNNPKIMEYIEKFAAHDCSMEHCAGRRPLLFYMWGHSYEFDRQNNWDRLEKICQKFTDIPDVWYATNIEIYRYVEAYHALDFSADGEICFNPTLYQIWFEADRKLYHVDSGQTVRMD